MQVPKNIEVKDKNGNRVAYLSPRADRLKDCNVDLRLNGESVLEFSLPVTSEKIGEITAESEVWVNEKVYIFRKDDAFETVRDENNKLWAKFSAVERWGELSYSYVEPSVSNDPTAKPPADLAVIIVGGGADLSGGRYAVGTAGHALYAILQGSGWSLGDCDVDGVHDLEMEKASHLSLVKKIQELWGGYLVWDSVNRVVHLRSPDKWQNYTGFQVRYRKNLKHITRTQSNKLITKLYPFGYEDLDIANVNGGRKYITDNSYTDVVYVGMYKNNEIYNANELREKAIAELSFNCRPRYLYKVKMVDLRTLPEYSHEDFALGDMVDIIDPDIAPDSPRPRIIRHKYNVFKPWECELDIGDPEERLIEQLKASFNTTDFIDGVFDGNGEMSGDSLNDGTVTDAKIKNLHAEKITAGFLDADRIEAGSISIGKVDEGFVPGMNLLENPVFSSYAGQMNEIDGVVTHQGTLIQQNAEQITLQAVSINGLNRDMASINLRANSIELSVSNVSTTVSNLSTTVTQNQSSINQRADSIELSVSRVETTASNLDDDINGRYGLKAEFSIMADNITSKVSYTDYTGREIASLINQDARRITISAEAIDLTGVTSIYGDYRSEARFDRYGDFIITHDGRDVFTIYNGQDFVQIGTHIGTMIEAGRSDYMPRGRWDFGRATVRGIDAVQTYYGGDLYIDASSYGITVRNSRGNSMGTIPFE